MELQLGKIDVSYCPTTTVVHIHHQQHISAHDPGEVSIEEKRHSSLDEQAQFVAALGGRVMHTDNLPEWMQIEQEKIGK